MWQVKRTHEVSILNQKFVLKSDADERYVQKVADYLNKKLHDIMNNSKSVSTLNVALLAALNVTDDFFRIREKNKESHVSLEQKLKELVTFIDGQIS